MKDLNWQDGTKGDKIGRNIEIINKNLSHDTKKIHTSYLYSLPLLGKGAMKRVDRRSWRKVSP